MKKNIFILLIATALFSSNAFGTKLKISARFVDESKNLKEKIKPVFIDIPYQIEEKSLKISYDSEDDKFLICAQTDRKRYKYVHIRTNDKFVPDKSSYNSTGMWTSNLPCNEGSNPFTIHRITYKVEVVE